MTCFVCEEAQMSEQLIEHTTCFREEEYTVAMTALVCPNCGNQAMEGSEVPNQMRLIADAYRERHGLLTSDAIRRRRAALGMNQRAFAKYLSVGEASIKRWELSGIQDDAMDKLIRILTKKSDAQASLRGLTDLLESSAATRAARKRRAS